MPLKAITKATRFVFADGGSIKARVLRSGVWVGASEVGLAILGLVRSVVLARLLTPEMFGLMGLAMIVVRAIETFTRPGVAQALIARQQDFDEASSTAFTMLVARAVILVLLLSAAAPWLASFYETEQLQLVLQVLSLVFLIGSFSNINTIARQRELDFRRLTYLSQTANLAGTIVTISVAFVLRSVWALVIGQIVQATLTMLLSYYFIGGRVRFAFNREVARDLLSYGKFITGSSAVLYIATELDSAVIGKVLGAEQLGFYTLAATIAYLATTNLSKVASNIMMPAYSKLQSDVAALRNAYLRALSFVMFAILPATAGLIVVAQPLIQVVYGDKWLSAVIPLQILVVFGLLRSLAAFSGYLFEGMGKPKIAFRLGLIRLAVIAPIIVPMTGTWGLLGAAVSVTLGIAAQWLAGLVYLRKEVAITPFQIVGAVWRPVWTAAAMAVVVYVLRSAWDKPSVSTLVVMILCGIAIYGVLNVSYLRKLKQERLS